MIFNTSSYDNGVVQESPYECGLYGAMMHVYENECNYNAMMKAVGLSELKYYQETGGDLFVQEAGALSGFIAKAKAFFKKVIEKIKSIFHKFAATINQFTMSNKDFAKKYEKELRRKNYTDMEFEGYLFPGLGKDVIKTDQATNVANKLVSTDINSSDYDAAKGKAANDPYYDSDTINDEKEENRGKIIGKGKLDSTEFRDELKEAFYGDKETIDIGKVGISQFIELLKTTDKDVRDAEKTQKNIIKGIEDFIKNLDKAETTFNRNIDKDNMDNTNAITRKLNRDIDVYKSLSNDYTVAFGMKVQAMKDRAKQAKAICVKAVSYKYKNESARYSEGAYDDIFGDVKIV